MIRVCPCELPRSWTRGNCSRAKTDRPRRASSNAAAEPIPPAPTTMTSNAGCAIMSDILTESSRMSRFRLLTAVAILFPAAADLGAQQKGPKLPDGTKADRDIAYGTHER